MKKLLNDVNAVVKDSMAGIEAAHGDIVKAMYDPNILIRAGGPVKGKVAVVSGGGSGHEPLHGGFVGLGMLHAACPGEIFTSPTPDQMEAATRAVDGGAGVLHIVKNYSGDVMNFEMAADLCRSENIDVESVVIDDDVAVKDSLYTQGRRGVGATVFAEKIAGAASERGFNLQKVKSLVENVNANARSMGMALTSCTVPAKGAPTFDIGEDEIEIGIGIHGEPGRERTKIKSAAELSEIMCDAILTDLPFSSNDEVFLMVNGMGGTPLIELYVVYNDIAAILKKKGIKITRNLVGNYITSLEMEGFSITLVKLNKELTSLWDDPVRTAGLRWGI
ncbi:MAG: dihydroxyacetone kinase subunit DhaK [Spirochaetales bacterium]|nr:MAG: dihydroxyacetone kinase subunit DhaK [Spirochaetales bacterium]